MSIHWTDTLSVLMPQFQANAEASRGLNHFWMSQANNDTHKTAPSWFEEEIRKSQNPSNSDEGIWSITSFTGGQGRPPAFRSPKVEEKFESTDENVICDKRGNVRAVFVPHTLVSEYYCGKPSEFVSYFESLATLAVRALFGASDLDKHVFAADLKELFNAKRSHIRYCFGEVEDPPAHFINRGWQAGYIQYENGVLIDLPLSAHAPTSKLWTELLHRLAWKKLQGCPLSAERTAWNGNVEASIDLLNEFRADSEEKFLTRFQHLNTNSYYSILGSKESPIDINLASVLAIKLLLSELSITTTTKHTEKKLSSDYSNECWNKLPEPTIKTISKSTLSDTFQPKLGIMVATEIEMKAILRKLRPLKHKRNISKVHVEKLTYFFGRLGLVEVIVCRCAMGSVGRDSSTIVTSEFVEEWKLSAVVMIGIAFGRDEEKQNIGNILVSNEIIPYESERVGTNENQQRAISVPGGCVLLDRFRNVVGWNFSHPNGRSCEIQLGPVLSGEKLVDDFEFKRFLFEKHPQAIGGEMEGAGVAAACTRKNCEWIIAKSICDWGDGTKQKDHQGFAAAASVSLLEHILNQVDALEAL